MLVHALVEYELSFDRWQSRTPRNLTSSAHETINTKAIMCYNKLQSLATIFKDTEGVEIFTMT
jgi:hypothetical protein